MFFLVVHMMFKRPPLAFLFFSSKLPFIIPKCNLPQLPPSHSSHRGDLISQVPKSGADSYFMHVKLLGDATHMAVLSSLGARGAGDNYTIGCISLALAALLGT